MAESLFTRRFWLACGMHFTGAMALSLYILFPLFIRGLGGSELTIGLYAGMTGAAAVMARVPLGHLLDTYGRRRVLIVAGMLHVVAWLAFSSIDRLGVRSALLVVMYGLADGALFASYFTYASDIVPITRRAEGIAMFGIWGMLPNGLGPLLAEVLIRRGGFHAYFLVGAAFAFVSLCISLLLPESVPPLSKHAKAGSAPPAPFQWGAITYVLGATFMFAIGINGLFTFIAPFAHSAGRASIGSFFMTYAGTAVTVRVFAGRLPDRLGLRRVLLPALLLHAAGILLVPHVFAGTGLLAVGVMCGFGHGYAFPILNVLVVDRVPAMHRGRAVTWFTAMFDLGNSMGNPILGALAKWVGYPVMFTASGIGVLMAASIVWRKVPPPP